LDAQFDLSEMYRQGLGVAKDDVKSTEWLDKALQTDKQAVWLCQVFAKTDKDIGTYPDKSQDIPPQTQQ